MSAILTDKVLVINRTWQAVAETTVAEAICDICSGKATGIDTEHMMAVKWEDWLKLPIREGDRFLKTINGAVRVPTVVGKFSYDRMPKRKPKLDNRGIAARDRHVCQVTGEYAPDGNVDHLVPRSRGGATKSWTNMAWMRKDLNFKKGNRTLEEMGWKLLRTPSQPLELPACAFIPARHPDWEMFLPNKK